MPRTHSSLILILCLMASACAEEAVRVQDELTLEAVQPATMTPYFFRNDQIRVRVLASDGTPEAGVMVDWSTTSADAWLSPKSSSTDLEGYAGVMFTPGARLGSQTVRATAADQSIDIPVPVTSMILSSVTAAGNDPCGLDLQGRLWCWRAYLVTMSLQSGPASSGQGFPSRYHDYAPRRADDRLYSEVVGVNYGQVLHKHAYCALTLAGEARCWDDTDFNAEGRVSSTEVVSPTPLTKIAIARDAWPGSEITLCGLASDGRAWCRGDNRVGQLGDGTTISRDQFAPVDTEVRFKSLASGQGIFCGLDGAGAGWCWGATDIGDFLNPTAVPGGPYSQLTPTMGGACGLKAPPQLVYCWATPMLNPGDPEAASLIPGSSSTVQLVGGPLYAIIRLNDGRLRVVGDFVQNFKWGKIPTEFSDHPADIRVARLMGDDASLWCGELHSGATVCELEVSGVFGIPAPE